MATDDYGNVIVQPVQTGKNGGLTLLAQYDHALYYSGNGDEEGMTYSVAQAGSGGELCGCTCADWKAGSGQVLEAALADLAMLRSTVAALADRVADLELARVVESGDL